MKISEIRTFIAYSGLDRNYLFLEIETSTGAVGVGEATVEGKLKAVEAAIREHENYLIGKDPQAIEEHWQVMNRGSFWRGGPVLNSAISGIEIALWDILGQELGAPIHQLLGGACRRKIRAYTHILGNTAEEHAEMAKELVKRGYNALKMDPYSSMEGEFVGGRKRDGSYPLPHGEAVIGRDAFEKSIERVRLVREAVGKGVDLMLDLHGRTTPTEAIRFAHEVEKYNPLFIEEPVPPENVDILALVRNSSRVSIATGERIFTKYGFRELLEKKACQVLQPDVCHAGGILECKKIAAMAEANFAEMAPHNPLSPVATAACLQLDACIPNFLIQEVPSEDASWRERAVENAPKVVDGYFEIPSKPGLGVRLNHDALGERPYKKTDLPRFRREDGSLTEW